MFGFRGTMEKLRQDAKRFLTDPQIIDTLERSIKQRLMYAEAISHVQMEGHVKDAKLPHLDVALLLRSYLQLCSCLSLSYLFSYWHLATTCLGI